MAKIAVADTSPIIALVSIQRLWLLDVLFDEVVIALQVARELTAKPDAPEIKALADLKKISYRMPRARCYPQSLSWIPVSSMPITIASELSGAIVLIDERRGRKAALHAGLAVTGTVGVLVEAKRRGLINELKPLLVDLQTTGSFISQKLCREALRAVGE